jgi:cytosine/adenosine deaminase-related metal-dependent hydrolase
MLPVTNAHTHLELTDLSHLCPPESVAFKSWMGQVEWHLQHQSQRQVQASIDHGIRELKACRTTHVGDISATGESVEPLLRSGLQGIVYLEVRGLRRRHALQKLAKAKTAIQKARKHPNYGPMQVGLSLHAPYSCHPDLLQAGAAWCRDEGVPLCIHVAESPDETRLIRRGRVLSVNRLIGFLEKQLGLRLRFVPLQRPIPYIASLGVLGARPLIVHAIHVTDMEIRTIADAGCAVVHCPRSNVRLSCGRMPLERFLFAGVPVYLGTDSRASSPSLDVRAEARFAQSLHSTVVDSEKVGELIHQSFP